MPCKLQLPFTLLPSITRRLHHSTSAVQCRGTETGMKRQRQCESEQPACALLTLPSSVLERCLLGALPPAALARLGCCCVSLSQLVHSVAQTRVLEANSGNEQVASRWRDCSWLERLLIEETHSRWDEQRCQAAGHKFMPDNTGSYIIKLDGMGPKLLLTAQAVTFQPLCPPCAPAMNDAAGAWDAGDQPSTAQHVPADALTAEAEHAEQGNQADQSQLPMADTAPGQRSAATLFTTATSGIEGGSEQAEAQASICAADNTQPNVAAQYSEASASGLAAAGAGAHHLEQVPQSSPCSSDSMQVSTLAAVAPVDSQRAGARAQPEPKLLRWFFRVLGNTALEFGAIPASLQDEHKALHKCVATKDTRAQYPVGISSCITVGSELSTRIVMGKQCTVELLLYKQRLSCIVCHPEGAEEVQWRNTRTERVPYKGPRRVRVDMDVPLRGPIKLAATTWAHCELALGGQQAHAAAEAEM